MTGIDQEKLEQLIENNKINVQNINDSSEKLTSLLNEINDECNGKMLDDMFFSIESAEENLKLVNNYTNNYINFLESVKKSYILQDVNFGQQFGNKN